MIVAPITGKMENAMPYIEMAAKKGFGGVEIRYDRIREPELEKLMKKAKELGLSVMFTCMRLGENGGFEGDNDDWLKVCRQAASYEPDFLSIGIDYYASLAPKVELHGRTNRVISYHNFSLTPHNVGSICEEMWNMQPVPDVVKVAAKVSGYPDAIRLLGIVADAKSRKQRVISVAMGEKKYTAWQRLMCLPVGAELSFFAIEEGMESAKGQPTIDEAVEAALALNIKIDDYRR